MLVISRKLSGRIYIGDDIVITVVDIDRGKVRIGIEAPREMPVFREELCPPGHKTPSDYVRGSAAAAISIYSTPKREG